MSSKAIHRRAICVVGFPKSGNTWLARLLAEVTHSNIATDNALDVVNAADNSEERSGDWLIHKFHVRDVRLLPMDSVLVYIVRDIRDVLVSAFFFNNKWVSMDSLRLDRSAVTFSDRMRRLYFQHQIRRMNRRWCGNELAGLKNLVHGVKNTIGGWSDHVVYWSQQPGIILVRYEDLLIDVESEVRRVLIKLGIQASEDAIRSAAERQSFESRRQRFLASGDAVNMRFLRSGRSGDWRNFLIPPLVRRIEKRHGRTMRINGYALEFEEMGE